MLDHVFSPFAFYIVCCPFVLLLPQLIHSCVQQYKTKSEVFHFVVSLFSRGSDFLGYLTLCLLVSPGDNLV